MDTLSKFRPWDRSGLLGVGFAVFQLIGFGSSLALGVPTGYAFFAVISAGVIAYVSGYGWFGVVSAVLGSILLLGLGIPLAMLIVNQDLGVVAEKALSSEVHRVLYLSVYAPLLAASVSVVLGVPLAYLLAQGFKGQKLVESLVDLPLVVPHSVAGIAVLYGFGEKGVFPQAPILLTLYGAVIAMVFVSAPYVVNSARQGFEGIDDEIEMAARTLGSGDWRTFRHISLPLASKSIYTGGILAWARSVSEFGAVVVVANSIGFFYPPAGEVVRSKHAPVYVFELYSSEGLEASGAVAVLLLGISAVIFLGLRLVSPHREKLL